MAGKKGKKGRKGEKNQDDAQNEGKLTPYQGKLRTFGWFKCPECQRSWASAHSWANRGQMCKACNINVYPYRQAPRERGTYVSDPKKNHDQPRCEKCREIHAFCGMLNEQDSVEEPPAPLPTGKKRNRRRRRRAAAA